MTAPETELRPPHRILTLALLALALSSGCSATQPSSSSSSTSSSSPTPSSSPTSDPLERARQRLATLAVQPRGSYAGYARTAFGEGWADTNHNGCDDRDDVLHQQLRDITFRPHTDGCVVVGGLRDDPYTGQTLRFERGPDSPVNMDHVVALGNAWVSGASSWPRSKRVLIANDPLNLLAVSKQANSDKGDDDAAHWLPPRRAYWCAYVERQIDVKAKYGLTVTSAERDAMKRVLSSC